MTAETFKAVPIEWEVGLTVIVSKRTLGSWWRMQAMWALHNLVAHPISEITWWFGFIWLPIRSAGERLHDATVPRHMPEEGRG